MNETFKYIGISILFIISLIYTNHISNVVKSRDPIMIKINEVSNNIKVDSVNAVLNDDEIIPGKSGCDIDINKSYENMKKVNEYTEKMLKYKDLIPEITITNIYNKYISSGNRFNRNVSIVVYIKDDIEKLNKIDDIKLNVFLDGNMFNNGKIDISNNKKIYNGGIDGDYDDTTIEWVNDVISDYNNPVYCLNIDKNDNNLLICARNRMHTISPKIMGNNILKLKSNIDNGSIIYFDENNIGKINIVSDYILKKGYNIVYLDELLNENICNKLM